MRADTRIPRDIWMTFTVSTCQVSGFTRSVTRMYLLCFNALRVLHRAHFVV